METCFDVLPKDRIKAVADGFLKADIEIKSIISEYAGNLQVTKCEKIIDSQGIYTIEKSHYLQDDNKIRMDERKDTEEYVITFRHEYGHFIDEQLGRPSLKEEFGMAIQADFFWYNRNTDYGEKNLKKMLTELEKSETIDSRYFSDILSGIFHNDRVVREVYDENGVAFYGHTNYYWGGIEGPENAVEKEVFANLFAIYAENNGEIVSFVEKSFPNIVKQFRRTLGDRNGKSRI